MDEPLNLFPKRQKFPILQPDELLKSRWLDEFFIEMTMKVITLLRVSTDYFFKKLFWRRRHTDVSNKENEHFYKQCLLNSPL